MDFLNLIQNNLVSAPILFFALGIIAGLVKSDLSVPDSISRYLALYLMMAIGFKGGVAISETSNFDAQVLITIAAGILTGFLQPFIGYSILKIISKLDNATAAAVAAHYGSISMVTFVTAATFLDTNGVIYAGYIIAVLALMEAPAIMTGLFLAHKTSKRVPTHLQTSYKKLFSEILTNGAILLLSGSFLIGWISGTDGMDQLSGFLEEPFQGILALFLLDMGLLVSKRVEDLKQFTLPLFFFGIIMPLIGAATGLSLAFFIGLDIGTGFLFTILVASSSYIAVPAAMRLALPQANASVYIPMSLAVTFPFNILFGIPLYYALAEIVLG